MAYEASQPLKISLEAGADLSAKQYYFVKLDSAGKAIVCAGTTDKPIGVLQNKPTSGQTAEITVLGVSKVSTDAALAIDDLIGTSADGQAAAYVNGTDTTKYIVGRALVTSGGAGEITTILVNCASSHRAA